MAINDSMIDAEIWIENHCIVRKTAPENAVEFVPLLDISVNDLEFIGIELL